jgi:hypothetical protein
MRIAKMMLAIPVLGLAMMGPAQAAKAPARASAPPRQVAAAIAAELRKSGEKASPARQRGALTPIDIDGDGLRDWAVDWGKLSLPGWCGTGGCRYQMWRGTAGGSLALVFDQQVRATTIRTAGGERVFDFDFHGSTCRTFGAAECLVSFAWDPKAGRLAERVNPNGDGTVRYVVPLEPGMQGYPQAVRAAIDDMVKFCTSVGAKPDAASDDEALPASIPDVDGDGQRDWAFTGQNCIFGDGREPIVREDGLLITAGDPAHPQLFAPGGLLEFSVSTVPATVSQIITATGCVTEYAQPDDTPCPRKPWRWDAATRKLVLR